MIGGQTMEKNGCELHKPKDCCNKDSDDKLSPHSVNQATTSEDTTSS